MKKATSNQRKNSSQIIVLVLGGIGILFAANIGQAKTFADKENKQYHAEGCPLVETIEKRNLRIFKFEPEAESRGFYSCQTCLPPVNQISGREKQKRKLSVSVTRGQKYLGNKQDKIFHHEWCVVGQQIPPGKKIKFSTAPAALNREYQPCPECNPPVLYKRKAPEAIIEALPDKTSEEAKATSETAQAEVPKAVPGKAIEPKVKPASKD